MVFISLTFCSYQTEVIILALEFECCNVHEMQTIVPGMWWEFKKQWWLSLLLCVLGAGAISAASRAEKREGSGVMTHGVAQPQHVSCGSAWFH